MIFQVPDPNKSQAHGEFVGGRPETSGVFSFLRALLGSRNRVRTVVPVLLKHLEQLLVEVALQEGHLELARGLLQTSFLSWETCSHGTPV